MGVLRSTESREADLEEFRRMLLLQDGHRFETPECKSRSGGVHKEKEGGDGGDHGDRIVCVTSGISYLGFAVVNCLLNHGYSVRLAVETPEDLEKLREMEMFSGRGGQDVCAVTANVLDSESLCQAFDGCTGVFHTSAFADPGGISGYSKHLAEMEVRAAEKVIEACVRTPSVRKCVFTSSLLACIWRQNYPLNQRSPIILDESCWSDESLCRDKKLWFALGKTMAEKAAWRAARGRDLKLVTVCPGLITGLGFSRRNPSGSIAYLKGGHEMYASGLLATIDIGKVAEAHMRIYEAMGSTACGRYICFDRAISRDEEADELEKQLRLPSRLSTGTGTGFPTWFELCNRKLSRLMSRTTRCSYAIYPRMLY